jgi:hypothetical protein
LLDQKSLTEFFERVELLVCLLWIKHLKHEVEFVT